ncbi:uncharacterized protein HMPREF1541_00931 [Cyphellophora europaea CBS 101466]|uniref:DUF1275 domain protein n=1 Tax=Cyphellophora europaea (strain CBS 101466) TaxID=1220924 RepID=W2SDG7_CYPE1|nr:uncharacterized protein HMPREF1541_00931 [Cyphellophora europaea CBS 101466]ETN46742.1 hypothetical protein HMPREF1541_00931 [Cyphellophora europaea CBS 101466]
MEKITRKRLSVVSDQAKNTHKYLSQELDIQWMGLPILICFFTSGLIDSVAFNSWNCFVGMQTGNTIFAALGLSGQPDASHKQQYYKSLVSIGSFCLGTLFFSALHRFPTSFHQQPSSRRRWVFSASFALQAMFITISAILVTLNLVSDLPYISGVFSSGSDRTEYTESSMLENRNFLDLCPIALLAFGAAGQVTLSRTLGIIELPTIVLSTLYHDFTADLYNLRRCWCESTSITDFFFNQQRRQEKRLFSIIALFVGGIVGGEMYKSSVGMAGALWLAAGLKLSVSLMWLFWKKDPSEEEDDESTLPQ